MIRMEKVHSIKLYGELDFSDYIRPRSSKFKSNWHTLNRYWVGDIFRKFAIFADLPTHQRMRAWLGSFNSSIISTFIDWPTYNSRNNRCVQQKSSIPAMYFNWLIFPSIACLASETTAMQNHRKSNAICRWIPVNVAQPEQNIVISYSSTRMASPLKRSDSQSELTHCS